MTDRDSDTGNGEDESAEERSQYGGTEQKDLVGAENGDGADDDEEDDDEEEEDAKASERTSEGEAEGQDVPGP